VLCAPSASEDPTGGEQPVAVVAVPGWSPSPFAPASPFGPLPAPSNDGALIVQTRSPTALVLYDGAMHRRFRLFLAPGVADLGHSTFHADVGIACAQCHPEGGEDGRVWNFSPLGRRRTQSLRVGLAGTEPFHWSGTLPDFAALVHEVFERRMGGQPLPDARLTKLRDWVFSLPPLSPIRAADMPEVTRGRALFESERVGCVGCHDGAGIAKSSNVDVGVDSPNAFQIPALRGVGYRAPFLHDGCAATLLDRFDPACGGGDRHGKTSQLSRGELDELVAYLESL
jgi:cytochrome c peroxidase